MSGSKHTTPQGSHRVHPFSLSNYLALIVCKIGCCHSPSNDFLEGCLAAFWILASTIPHSTCSINVGFPLHPRSHIVK